MLSQTALLGRFREGATTGSASHLFIEDNVLYSYGHHFPLAIRRDWGAGIAFLVNGDRYSVTTSHHQHLSIRHLKPNVQIPFSALSAANLIGAGSVPRIRVVAWREDQYHTTCKVCGRELMHPNGENGPDYFAFCHEDDNTPLCQEPEPGVASHHVLGAVVLKDRRKFFLSSIDEDEGWRRRSYFLCRLPCPVTSVEEGFSSLVPDEIRLAQARGREVRRQGDIFAIETMRLTRELPGPTTKHVRLFETSHVASQARRVNGTLYVRGTLRHEPTRGRAQHAMLRLGRSWWQAFQNRALGSWNAVGNVD